MKKKVITICILLLALSLDATTFYVSTNGNDTNSGTSENNAWKTISKAANTLEAGDEVIILKGTYEEQVVPKNSGSEENYIIYRAKEGHTVIIDGKNLGSNVIGSGLFFIKNKKYIKVFGFALHNFGPLGNDLFYYDRSGVIITESNHIIIRNCTIRKMTSSGIMTLQSHHIIIDGNDIGDYVIDNSNSLIQIGSYTNTFEIMNNNIHNFSGMDDASGVKVEFTSFNGSIHHNTVQGIELGVYIIHSRVNDYNKINIYNNKIFRCSNPIVLNTALKLDINIFNNLIYKYSGSGIYVVEGGFQSQQPNTRNLKIINNIINSGYGGEGINMYLDGKFKGEGVIIKNNICSNNIYEQIKINNSDNLSKIIIENNLTFGNQSNTSFGVNNFWNKDPKFVDVTNSDFHLESSSPAIDNGSNIDSPDFDFDGNSRPSGNGWDIGAFEFNGTLATDDFRTSQKKAIVYPNPFKNEAIIKISNNEAGNYTLKLYNSYGQIIKIVSDISKTTYKLQRGNLENGIYFFQILQHGKTFTEGRFIIN